MGKSRRLLLPVRELACHKRELIRTVSNGRIERGRLVLDHRARSFLPTPYKLRPLRERMAVAFNAKATADTTSGTAATSVNINNLTIGAISNVALLVFCSFNSDPGVITTKTWNGVSLIEVGRHAASDGATAVLLAMVGATTGNHTLALVWTNLTGYTIDLASFSGADQTANATTFKNFTFLASSVSSGTDAILITVNSPTNDLAVACVAALNVGLAAGLTGTNIYFDNTNVSGAAAYVAGSGVSSLIGFDVSATTNQPQVTVACDVAAVGSVVVVGDTLAINQDVIFM